MIVVVNERDEIQPNLWLGAMPKDIADFAYVFCLADYPAYKIKEGQRVVCQPFRDEKYVPDEVMLKDLASDVSACCKRGKTLVHCTAGLNRSGLIVALALMKDGLSASDAISLLRTKRDLSVLENNVFEQWLLAQEVGVTSDRFNNSL